MKNTYILTEIMVNNSIEYHKTKQSNSPKKVLKTEKITTKIMRRDKANTSKLSTLFLEM